MPQPPKPGPVRTGAVDSADSETHRNHSVGNHVATQAEPTQASQIAQRSPTKEHPINAQPELPPKFNAREQLVLLQRVISLACFAVTMLNSTLPLYGASVGVEGLDVGSKRHG